MAIHTRRRFLEDSLLAAAALAAGPAIECVAAEPQSKSKNDKLGIAVVGVNGQGNSHLQAYAARKDVEIRYIVDADTAVGEKRAGEIEKKTGKKPIVVQDLRKALEDKTIDCVSTATPNHWHALVAIWSMQAGKDVYVEKPVSHNVSEGRRIVETARKYNRICQTGTQCRSMGANHEAIKYISDGKIGEVKMARGLCYKLRKSIGPRGEYPIPSTVDYNLWSGPAPMAKLTRPKLHYDWHWQWLCGNGDLGNQGIHQMDVARWGLGIDTLSNRVLSFGGRLGYEDAGETANTQVIFHEFPNGKSLVFEVRGLNTDPLMDAKVGVIFYGTDGYVVMTSYVNGVALDKNKNVVQKFAAKGDHFDNFLKAVRSRNHKDLNADILEGHLSSALCHTGNISYRLGEQVPGTEVKKRLAGLKTNDNPGETFDRVASHLAANGVKLDAIKMGVGSCLDFDPKTETFPGNSAANAMLTREYRKPFVVPAAGQV